MIEITQEVLDQLYWNMVHEGILTDGPEIYILPKPCDNPEIYLCKRTSSPERS